MLISYLCVLPVSLFYDGCLGKPKQVTFTLEKDDMVLIALQILAHG